MRQIPAVVIMVLSLMAVTGHASEAMGVITEVDGAVEIVGADGKRDASTLSVVRQDEKVVVQADATATVRFNGRSYPVTGENSPFTLPEEKAGATVASNLLDWATGILAGDETGLAQSVAAVSRGQARQVAPLLSPMWNRVQRRSGLLLPHAESVQLTGARVESGGQSREVSVSRVSERVSRLNMEGIAPGEYALELCSDSCQSGMLDWRESLAVPGDISPDSAPEASPELHATLALIRRGGGEYGLEAFQRLHSLRSENEIAKLFYQRLRDRQGEAASR